MERQSRFRDFFRKTPVKTVEVDYIPNLPTGRVSSSNFESSFDSLKTSLQFVKEGYHKELIPILRKLLILNSSLSLAVIDSVQLCNPGFSIDFDSDTPPEQVQLMREHIRVVTKKWGAGTPGLHGLINKLMYQLFIGGANAVEWVIKNDLSGVDFMAMLKPEDIRIAYSTTNKYTFYQKPTNVLKPLPGVSPDLIKLNPFTFQYYELINDLEEPQGIPPFVSALIDINTQTNILKNINTVADQYGLMGFLQLLLRKPSRMDGEGEKQYTDRLEALLTNAKASVISGLKSGVSTGYKGDHEFDFFSVSKESQGLSNLFDINHRMVANGLLTSPGFMGGATGGSETHINIIFTKMLSQMNNIQEVIKAIIEYGLWLELTLSGFKFKRVILEFQDSTITDALKSAQTEEINIRNSRILYADGQLSQGGYAHRVGLEKPDKKEPRVPIDPDKIVSDKVSKDKVEKDKDTSDRTSRDKTKSQPARKDQDTKKR